MLHTDILAIPGDDSDDDGGGGDNNNNNNKSRYFETLGPMNLSALNLLNDLGRKISSVSGDDREGHFLFQRLSVILQRYRP